MKIKNINVNNANVQNIINFETADCAFKDALSYYNKYELYKNNYDADYSYENKAALYYTLNQYCIQRFTQALESYFKAISICNGNTWDDNKRIGHSLFDLYNAVIPNDIKYKVDELFLYSDKYVEQVLDLKMLYINYSNFDGPYQSIMLLFLEKKLKDLSANKAMGMQNANVSSRFPGEKYLEYDTDFLYNFSKIINIITFKYRSESTVLEVDAKSNANYVKEELSKVFKQIDIKLMNYDPNFISFVQNRIDHVYSLNGSTKSI